MASFMSFPPIDEECCVCYSKDVHSFIALSCNHVLCHSCADKISTLRNETIMLKCPLCRREYEWSLESTQWVSVIESERPYSWRAFCVVVCMLIIVLMFIVGWVIYQNLAYLKMFKIGTSISSQSQDNDDTHEYVG